MTDYSKPFNIGGGVDFPARVAKIEADGYRIRCMTWVPGHGWEVETVPYRDRSKPIQQTTTTPNHAQTNNEEPLRPDDAAGNPSLP